MLYFKQKKSANLMKADEEFFKSLMAKIGKSNYYGDEETDDSEDSYDEKQIKIIDKTILKHSEEMSSHLKRRSSFWQQLNRQK